MGPRPPGQLGRTPSSRSAGWRRRASGSAGTIANDGSVARSGQPAGRVFERPFPLDPPEWHRRRCHDGIGDRSSESAFAAGAHLTCRRTGRSTDRHEIRNRVPAGRGEGEARRGIVGTAGVGILPKGGVPNSVDGEQEGPRFSLLKAGPPRATVFDNKRIGLQTSIRRVSAVTAGTPGTEDGKTRSRRRRRGAATRTGPSG